MKRFGQMVDQARLEDVGSGLAPVSEGWFVVNVRDAAWLTNDAFGARCVFEGGMPVLRARPDLPAHRFAELGITLQVLEPGMPSGMYHAESNQEDFLVLAGECVLVIEERERPLHAWDFVHCAPGTAHAFVGAGDGPCVILMAGRRSADRTITYPASDVARRHAASVETETTSAVQAYADRPHWQPARPKPWDALPWNAARSSSSHP